MLKKVSISLKYATLPILLVLSTSLAHATIVNHGGYTATETSFQWEDLSISSGATRVLGNNDDSYRGPISLGFDFSFFDQTFNEVYITSNGLLTFGGSTTNNDNHDLSEYMSFSARPMIAVAWDDWTTTYSGTDGVYYETLGNVGSRSFVTE